MKDKGLDKVLSFVDLLHKFRAIERRVLVRESERRENDVEHSYSLAMLAWYINDSWGLGLDKGKLFSYALSHDMVEAYAGDTYLYADAEVRKGKKEREERAIEQLKEAFPEFSDMHAAIAVYEARNDDESKFVYALDKVEPILNIYLDEGRSWKKDGVTLEMLESTKRDKVTIDPHVAVIFEELVLRLKKQNNELFPN